MLLSRSQQVSARTAGTGNPLPVALSAPGRPSTPVPGAPHQGGAVALGFGQAVRPAVGTGQPLLLQANHGAVGTVQHFRQKVVVFHDVKQQPDPVGGSQGCGPADGAVCLTCHGAPP